MSTAPNTNSFSWEDLRGPEPKFQQSSESPSQESLNISTKNSPKNQKENWEDFQSPMTYQGPIDPNADESLFDYLLRGRARISSRIAEQVLGAPGNIEKFVRNILPKFPEADRFLEESISKYIGSENAKKFMDFGQQIFAPSSVLKKESNKLSKGYLSPKTKGENRLDELIEDVSSTFLTRRIPAGRFQQIANHFLIPAAANVTKNIVEDAGFGEDKANQAKMAVWFPLSLANNVNGSRYASSLMNRGRNGFNQNDIVNVNTYQNQLNNVSRNMLYGDPRSALAQQQIAGIENDIANGRISMRDLMTRYDALNAAKRDRGLFSLNRADRRAAVRNINQVRDVVRDQIRTLGASNPQALRDWENGVQAWATIHTSNAVTNSIESMAKGPYAKALIGPATALFGVSGYGAIKHPLVAASGGTVATGLYKTGQILYRMWNNPALRNYYWNAITGALEMNAPVFFKNYDKLNKELEKEEK